MYLEQELAGLFSCLNWEIFSRTGKWKREGPNQSRVVHYSTLSRLEYPGDHRKNYKEISSGYKMFCWDYLNGVRSSWDIEAKKLLLIWKEHVSTTPNYPGGNLEDPCSFQGIFATLSCIFKSFLLCRYHSEILLRSGLYRAKEKGIGHADIRLLT
jgi:hypothetical protein